MQRFSFAAGFVLAGLILLGMTCPISAGDQVPFNGTLDGDQFRTPLDDPFVLDQFYMTGNSTQLGEYDLLIEATVNTAMRTASGRYYFVAANGDELTAEFEGSSMPTATPGVILIMEIATIDGGTGRFAGATGSFVCERLFEIASATSVGTYTGTISNVRAK